MSDQQTKSQKNEFCEMLERAISQQELNLLQSMIEDGFDVNSAFDHVHVASGSFGPHHLCDHPTPLVMAVWKNWKEGVELLLESGADIEKPDFRESKRRCWKYTPLMHAVGYQHNKIIKLLIDKGADVNGFDKITNHTPLHVATNQGDAETVKMLLEKGAKTDVVSYDNGSSPNTPLLCALDLSALPWPDDADSMDKYEEILRNARYELVKLMTDRGCDVNLFGRDDPTPLGMCSKIGDIRVLKLLLEAGANVNGGLPDKSADKETEWFDDSDIPKPPITTAISADKVTVIIILIQHGADIFSDVIINEWTGKQALLEYTLECSSFKAALILLDAGCVLTEKARHTITQKYTRCFPEIRDSNKGKGKIDGQNKDTQLHVNPSSESNIDHDSLAEEMRKSNINSTTVESEGNESDELESEGNDESPIEESEDDDDSMLDGTFSSGSGSDYEDDFEKYAIKALMTKPEEMKSLKLHIRTFLRRKLGLFSPSLVEKLPLPKSLQEYVLCYDLKTQDYMIETTF